MGRITAIEPALAILSIPSGLISSRWLMASAPSPAPICEYALECCWAPSLLETYETLLGCKTLTSAPPSGVSSSAWKFSRKPAPLPASRIRRDCSVSNTPFSQKTSIPFHTNKQTLLVVMNTNFAHYSLNCQRGAVRSLSSAPVPAAALLAHRVWPLPQCDPCVSHDLCKGVEQMRLPVAL